MSSLGNKNNGSTFVERTQESTKKWRTTIIIEDSPLINTFGIPRMANFCKPGILPKYFVLFVFILNALVLLYSSGSRDATE